jgi:chitinase
VPTNAPDISIAIATPASGSTFFVNGAIKLTATASCTDSTIKSVDYYINGGFIMSKASSPYTFNTASDAPNSWVVTALATAKNGNVAISSPITVTIFQDVAPVVAITAPADGSVFPTGSAVSLAATASSQYSTVSSVAFYNGSTLIKKVTAAPYAYTWAKPGAGSHTITAVATDGEGMATTSSAVTITIN